VNTTPTRDDRSINSDVTFSSPRSAQAFRRIVAKAGYECVGAAVASHGLSAAEKRRSELQRAAPDIVSPAPGAELPLIRLEKAWLLLASDGTGSRPRPPRFFENPL
jgi:hypothetical protein